MTMNEMFGQIFAEENAWKQQVKEMSGYDAFTTFWSDLSIAEYYGAGAIKDTCKDIKETWLDDVKYYTEFILVLNHKIWHYYGKNEALAKLYNELWCKYDQIGVETYENDSEKSSYYYRTLD